VSCFLRSPCTKKDWNRFIFNRVIPKIKRVTFFGTQCISTHESTAEQHVIESERKFRQPTPKCSNSIRYYSIRHPHIKPEKHIAFYSPTPYSPLLHVVAVDHTQQDGNYQLRPMDNWTWNERISGNVNHIIHYVTDTCKTRALKTAVICCLRRSMCNELAPPVDEFMLDATSRQTTGHNYLSVAIFLSHTAAKPF